MCFVAYSMTTTSETRAHVFNPLKLGSETNVQAGNKKGPIFKEFNLYMWG